MDGALEPLLPLQVFNIRKDLENIVSSKKSDAVKEMLIEKKLNEVIDIFKMVSEKIKDLTDNKKVLTLLDAKQMFQALSHLTKYLYSKYNKYQRIEKEAVSMMESTFSFDRWFEEGKIKGEIKSSKTTAYDMFLDNESIDKIRKYTRLSDEDLLEVLESLPDNIKKNYLYKLKSDVK